MCQSRGPRRKVFKGPVTCEPELLNSRCLTAVGLPTYSVQSHCSFKAGEKSDHAAAWIPEGNPKTRLLGLDVPDVDVAARGSDVDEVASRVEASVRRDFATRVSRRSGGQLRAAKLAGQRGRRGAARTGWSPSLRPRLLPSRPRQVAVRAPTSRLLHLANRQRLVGSAHAGSQPAVCCRSRK